MELAGSGAEDEVSLWQQVIMQLLCTTQTVEQGTISTPWHGRYDRRLLANTIHIHCTYRLWLGVRVRKCFNQ